MYCGQCGRPIEDRAVQCPYCGHRITGVMPILPEPPADPPTVQPRRRWAPRPRPRRAPGPSLDLPPRRRASRSGQSRGWRVFLIVATLMGMMHAFNSCTERSSPPPDQFPMTVPEMPETSWPRDLAEPKTPTPEIDEKTLRAVRELLLEYERENAPDRPARPEGAEPAEPPALPVEPTPPPEE